MTTRPRALRPADPSGRWYRVGPVLALAEPAGTSAQGETKPASTTADVYVYDTIGGWYGTTADDFVRDVADGLDVDQLVIHLNSPGGDAIEGVAIANVLRAHRARIVVRVDGMAASAASVIAMAGDEVVMSIGSMLMVHDPWTVEIGSAAEMRKAADVLDSTADALASTYAARAGGTVAQWRAVMQAETWYTADEAVAAGLADRVAAADETGTAEGEQVIPGASSSWWDMWDSLRDPERFDLSAFRHAGRLHAPEPAMPGRTTPAASAAGRSTTERSGPVPFLDDVRQRLGVAADADEATVLAALDKQRSDLGAAETLLAEQPTAPALPDGVVAVEQATLDELRANAALGRAAAERQARDDRERLVAAAVADGRIAPARREHWVTALAADPGAADVLAGLEKGLVPVGAEIGHAGDGSDPEADALYASVFGEEG